MEFTVKAIDSIEPKSVQQVEEELLKKHEQEISGEGQSQEPVIETEETQEVVDQEPELTEDQVLSYIGKRYNKQISSFDELMAERKENGDMPEDVAAYMKFKKETGRGFEDFLKLRKDYDSMDSEVLLKEYLSATQSGLDEEDIETLMDDYRFDEDIDDESKVKKVKIARKKAVAEAKKFFNEQKEKYKLPLESSGLGISDSEKEEFESYRQYIKEAKTVQEENDRKRKWFDQKTDEVFSKDFNGFEFNINDKKVTFSPGNAAELKKIQSNPMNFISKYLDESGLMKDAVGYHKALSIAMNPDRFAKFFYEQGLSDATEDVLRKTKNINMSERRAPEAINKGGMQVKSVGDNSGKGLQIRSIKKV
jgi:hypothetical protein